MFAKLKKKIEESDSGLATSSQISFSEISSKFTIPQSSTSGSLPDLHHKIETTKKEEKFDTVSKDFLEKENNEEIKDLGIQEISKVKSLLLKCENELTACNKELDQSKSELKSNQELFRSLTTEIEKYRNEADEKSKLVLNLETVVEKLNESNSQMICEHEQKDQIIKQLTEVEKNHVRLLEENSSDAFNKEKKLLTEEIDFLKKKNLELSGKISYLDSIINDKLDEYEALKHTHDTYRSKTSTILEDKETTIQNLDERIKILEKRVSDSGLCEDEKLQSIIQERNQFEQMLEESRLQLSEIKMNWSEKINFLETQISNLNRKIAEDCEENQLLETNSEKFKSENDSLKLKCEELMELNETLKDSKKNEEALKDEIHHCSTERNRLRIENESLNSSLRALRIEIGDINDKNKREETEAKDKIDKLMGQHSEQLEKEIENESKISNYEAIIKQHKADIMLLEAEQTKLLQKLSSTTQKFTNLQQDKLDIEKQMDEANSKCVENQKNIDLLEQELENAQQERDSLMIRNSELSQLSELAKKELVEEKVSRDKTFSDLETSYQDLQSQHEQLKQKTKSLESVAIHSVENSERVTELKTSVVDLESQLAEKNKIIKLQLQRIADMKKTLQKELKVQQSSDFPAVGDGLDISLLGINKISRNSISNSANGIFSANFHELLPGDTVNIQYLRHVVFKFMTSREYEASQLIKAVSVLLKFTKEQEKLIKDTLDWKMSWFGHKPEIRKP